MSWFLVHRHLSCVMALKVLMTMHKDILTFKEHNYVIKIWFQYMHINKPTGAIVAREFTSSLTLICPGTSTLIFLLLVVVELLLLFLVAAVNICTNNKKFNHSFDY